MLGDDRAELADRLQHVEGAEAVHLDGVAWCGIGIGYRDARPEVEHRVDAAAAVGDELGIHALQVSDQPRRLVGSFNFFHFDCEERFHSVSEGASRVQHIVHQDNAFFL